MKIKSLSKTQTKKKKPTKSLKQKKKNKNLSHVKIVNRSIQHMKFTWNEFQTVLSPDDIWYFYRDKVNIVLCAFPLS